MGGVRQLAPFVAPTALVPYILSLPFENHFVMEQIGLLPQLLRKLGPFLREHQSTELQSP